MTIGQVNSDLSWAPLVNGRFDLPKIDQPHWTAPTLHYFCGCLGRPFLVPTIQICKANLQVAG